MDKWDRLRIHSINIVMQIMRVGKLMVSMGTRCFRRVLFPAMYWIQKFISQFISHYKFLVIEYVNSMILLFYYCHKICVQECTPVISFWLPLLTIYISDNRYTWWARDGTERTGKEDPKWQGHIQDKPWLLFPVLALPWDPITVTTSWSLTVLLCKTPEHLSYKVRSCVFAREGYQSLALIISQWLQGRMPSSCPLCWFMMKNCNPKALPIGMAVFTV